MRLTTFFMAAVAMTIQTLAAEPALQTHTMTLERAPLERAFDGTIEAVNQGTVSAQTSGRVVQVMYDVNDFVPAGAVIVKLKGTEQRASLGQAESVLKEATAAEAEVQKRYTRVQELLKERVVSQQQVDQISAERDAAVARLASAKAGVDAAREGVSYTEVRAPYAGIVTKRHVEIGESVSPGTLLMSGLSLQYLRVSVDLPQSVVEKVRGIRKAAIYVNGKRVEAKKITIFPEASAQSNTFKTRVELPENATDLYPGMFVKVAFVVGESERLLIPASALVERSEITGVYIVAANGATTLRQVRLGHRFDNRIEVLAGLNAGDVVASDPIAAVAHLGSVTGPAHE
jgi:membrane fusion protein, multidrug efflux system